MSDENIFFTDFVHKRETKKKIHTNQTRITEKAVIVSGAFRINYSICSAVKTAACFGAEFLYNFRMMSLTNM